MRFFKNVGLLRLVRMRGVLGLFLALVVLLIVSVQVSRAQWGPDVRLTNDPAWASTSHNNAWSIAASGDTVHVVWVDRRAGNDEIYYKRSTTAGATWGADRRLTHNTAKSFFPSIAVSGPFVHVVWSDERNGLSEIYYKRSTDGGATWGADIRLTNNPRLSIHPSITVSGSDVHVVWCDDRDGNYEIYYKRSTNGGATWGPDIRLTNNPASSTLPSIAVFGPFVHVVWVDHRVGIGNPEIYYKRSTDGGATWGPDIRLTHNPAESSLPSIAASGPGVHVIWVDHRDGNPEIYYKRSITAGTTWEEDRRLTNNTAHSYFPSIVVSRVVVHVVWVDNRDGNYEIYYKRSINAGTDWELDRRLTNDPYFSDRPSVTVSGSVIHIVWTDDRNRNLEIYYKRDPTGNQWPP